MPVPKQIMAYIANSFADEGLCVAIMMGDRALIQALIATGSSFGRRPVSLGTSGNLQRCMAGSPRSSFSRASHKSGQTDTLGLDRGLSSVIVWLQSFYATEVTVRTALWNCLTSSLSASHHRACLPSSCASRTPSMLVLPESSPGCSAILPL
jgi:hypothetical protein